MTRFIAIDHGTKRIGLAFGDDEAKIAMPITTVAACKNAADTLAAILKVAKEYEPDEYIVGLPINMDCSEGPQAKLTRSFGQKLAHATRCPVHFVDERLSSKAARGMLAPAELTRKKLKARVDRVAAQVILQCFLDGQLTIDEPLG
jgi:putative Holliday junction resolvase